MALDADNKLLVAVVAGCFAIFGTLVTAIISVRSSIVSMRSALDLNERTAREARLRPFYEQQLRLSLDAARSAATMASTRDPARFAAARERFFELYFGELAVVET